MERIRFGSRTIRRRSGSDRARWEGGRGGILLGGCLLGGGFLLLGFGGCLLGDLSSFGRGGLRRRFSHPLLRGIRNPKS